MTNKPFGTLYIGVTPDLIKRVWEHKHEIMDGFTKRYKLHLFVYYECFATIQEAMYREKAMKKWNRNWKLRRIVDMNPEWNDLYNDIMHQQSEGLADMVPRLRGGI